MSDVGCFRGASEPGPDVPGGQAGAIRLAPDVAAQDSDVTVDADARWTGCPGGVKR